MKATETDHYYAPAGTEACCHGALVRRVTETDHYVLNHQLTGPVAVRVFYECAACGRRLAVKGAGEANG